MTLPLQTSVSRRAFLRQSAQWGAAASLAPYLWIDPARAAESGKLPVAGVTTVYRRNSHADVIFTKILEGYNHQGGPGPQLELKSLYVDQVGANDKSAELAARHGVRLCKTIEEAVTLGGDGVAVAGVISVAEHGDYPITEKTQQRQYPRRRFFDEIAAVFRKYNQAAPVFNDKHLSWNWKDAKHMYDVARELKIPFMAGSSCPVAWRQPALELPRGCEIDGAICIGYGGYESYGFHAFEGLQCMVERRKGGETGIKSIQAVSGEALWQAEKEGRWSRELFEAALATQPLTKNKDQWETRLSPEAPFYLIEYRDGLKACVAMAKGAAVQFSFACRLRGEDQPRACLYALEEESPYGHFSWLLHAIEAMIRGGKPVYPVERTLLTTGALDRAMHSVANGGISYETPELAIAYEPTDWWHAGTEVGTTPAGR